MPSYREYVIINMLVVFNFCLMVFTTLKLIGFKNISQFSNTVFYCFLSNCYRALLWSNPISFPEKYKLLCLVSVLSDAILTCSYFSFKNVQNGGN